MHFVSGMSDDIRLVGRSYSEIITSTEYSSIKLGLLPAARPSSDASSSEHSRLSSDGLGVTSIQNIRVGLIFYDLALL